MMIAARQNLITKSIYKHLKKIFFSHIIPKPLATNCDSIIPAGGSRSSDVDEFTGIMTNQLQRRQENQEAKERKVKTGVEPSQTSNTRTNHQKRDADVTILHLSLLCLLLEDTSIITFHLHYSSIPVSQMTHTANREQHRKPSFSSIKNHLLQYGMQQGKIMSSKMPVGLVCNRFVYF